MRPIASVIMPVHNGAAYVRFAIDSAIQQTCRDIEIVVVDDGSTDHTWEVLTDCAQQDARVVLLQCDKNAGPGAARNLAMGHARGQWFALLDADDSFLPHRLERLISRAQELNADLLADNLLLRNFATGAIIRRAFSDAAMSVAAPLTLTDIVLRDMPDLPVHSRFGFVKPIIRAEFLRHNSISYQEDIRAGSDFLFYFECIAHGARFFLDPGAWYVFSIRNGSVSNRPDLTRYHSIANNRILTASAEQHKSLMRALRRRQMMIDFDCFRTSVVAHDLLSSLKIVSTLPVPYVMRRLSFAVWRRLSAGPPAASLLE